MRHASGITCKIKSWVALTVSLLTTVTACSPFYLPSRLEPLLPKSPQYIRRLVVSTLNKALHATRSRLGTEKRLKTYLGQYHWVTALSPDRGRKTASWLTGWISIGGQVVLLASAGFYSSFMVQGLISLGNPSYHPERWHATLIYIGILIYCAMLNIIGEKVLPAANFISGMLTTPPLLSSLG